jgi:hypothetical protein
MTTTHANLRLLQAGDSSSDESPFAGLNRSLTHGVTSPRGHCPPDSSSVDVPPAKAAPRYAQIMKKIFIILFLSFCLSGFSQTKKCWTWGDIAFEVDTSFWKMDILSGEDGFLFHNHDSTVDLYLYDGNESHTSDPDSVFKFYKNKFSDVILTNYDNIFEITYYLTSVDKTDKFFIICKDGFSMTFSLKYKKDTDIKLEENSIKKIYKSLKRKK